MVNQKEKIVVIGYGWVGQANALALSLMGYPVFYYDVVSPQKRYSEKYSKVYDKIKPLNNPLEQESKNTWYLVCVGDRVDEKGNQDISLIRQALDSVKQAKSRVILRSTVLPQHLSSLNFDFYLPEFLHEKHGVEECFHPYYFVIGFRQNSKPDFLKRWQNQAYKVFEGTPEEASYIKYLSNIWNATRIAFINEFGNSVRQTRINADNVLNFLFENRNYLRYGKSFGGHCLPKDTLAFSISHNSKLFKAVLAANEDHKAEEHGLPEWFSRWNYQSQISFSKLVRLLGQRILSKFKNFFS